MEVYGNDSKSFGLFLENICRDIEEPDIDNSQTRSRIYSPRVTQSEIEGECLGWSLQYLAARNCPSVLAAAISRATCDIIVALDLSDFYLDETEDGKKEGQAKDSDNEVREDENNKEIEVTQKCIDGKKLMNVVVENVHATCKLWREDIPDVQIQSGLPCVSSHAIKNTRRKMEDCHVICQDINTLFGLKSPSRQSYYAVFDGHGGVEAALYAGSHLHYHICHSDDFQSDPIKAIKSAYKLTDINFGVKARKDGLRAGSTAVTALLRENKLYIGWLGDSQAVLVRDGQTLNLMDPHKPEREDEKARIESLGGCVVFFGVWRVNGNIAVSRAIGDAWDKPYICSDADVTEVELDGTEDYLVLGCDGLWDGLSAESLPEIVYKHLQDTNDDKDSVAKKLVTYARDNGSSDNISVIVVFLRDEIAEPQGCTNVFSFLNVKEDGQTNTELTQPVDKSQKLGEKKTVSSKSDEKQMLGNGPKDSDLVDRSINRDELIIIHRSNSFNDYVPNSIANVEKDSKLSKTENYPTTEHRKRPKKEKRFRQARKRTVLKSPIVWSFAGRNRVSVQNHKLNALPRATGLSGMNWALDVPKPVKLNKIMDKLSQTNLCNMVSDTDLSVRHPFLDLPLNATHPLKLEPISTSFNPFPSIMSYGSKEAVISSTVDKFKTRWRPRRLHKICTGGFYESPPSPLMNTGIGRIK